MNKIILMGRLTKDPEIRYTQSAEPLAVAKYTLAVNRRIKKEGEQDADFINCTAFGRSAEFTQRYLRKGMMVAVSGRLQISTYDDPSGKRAWYTDVIVEETDFAESKASFESRNASDQSYNNAPSASSYSAPPANKPSSTIPYPANNDFSPISESADDEDLPF